MTLPRLMAVMGSGETSPTMVKTHRELLARLGPPPVPAVMLDTPFGFQANADELVERAREYFRTSLQQELGLASFRSAAGADPLGYETMLARLREARYVFAGPGSPTYALDQWAGSQVPRVLSEKLETGGCVVFASAAALTLGQVTVPVYEIYKVGALPHWKKGLDLLAAAGLHVALIPHYNNAEGGTHDTRFCYLGEGRLAKMESELDDQTFVLGIDEHTGVILDLDSATATVVGLGKLTVRTAGRSVEFPSGAAMPISELVAVAGQLRAGDSGRGLPGGLGGGGAGLAGDLGDLAPARGGAPGDLVARASGPAVDLATPPDAPSGRSPLLAAIHRLEADFNEALAERDSAGAVRTILALDDELLAWANETFQADEAEQGRAALRGMVVRLGEAAAGGLADPAATIGPYVDALLDVRAGARRDKRWADADDVRDNLVRLGVEIQDNPTGTTWSLAR